MKKLRFLLLILIVISNILMTMDRIDFYKNNYLKNRFLHTNSMTYILKPKTPMTKKYINDLKKYSSGVNITRISYSFDRGAQKANIDIYNLDKNFSMEEKYMGYSINFYDQEKMLSLPADGRYIITGDKENILSFIDKYNRYLGKSINLEKETFFGSIGAYSYYGVSYKEIGILLVLISIYILKIIMDAKFKDIFIYNLFGYSNTKTIYNMSIKTIIQTTLCSILSMLGCMVYFTLSYGKIINFFIDMVFISSSICLILSITTLLLGCSLVIKNKSNEYKKLSNVFSTNIVSMIFLSVLFVLFFSGLIEDAKNMMNLDKEYSYMKSLNNYVTAEMYDSSVDISDNRYADDYHKKMLDLWSLSNDRGAIFFSPGSKYIKGYEQFPGYEYIDGEIYINNNYLDNIVVRDENGNRIRNIKDDEYSVTVLVPNKYKGNKEVIDNIKYNHLCASASDFIASKTWKNNVNADSYDEYIKIRSEITEEVKKFLGEKNLSKIKENIIYTDNKQEFYSYSLEFPVDKNQEPTGKPIVAPITYILNGKNFRDIKKYGNRRFDGRLYYVALGNGDLKLRISDYKFPEKDIIPLAEKVGQDYSSLKIMKLGDGVNQKINELNMKVFMYSFVSIATVIMMIVIVESDIQKYLYFNKKNISIKYFLGYSRTKIFTTYALRYLFISLFSFILIWFIKSYLNENIEYHFNYYIGLNTLFKVELVVSIIEFAYVIAKVKFKKISVIDMK